MALIRIHATRMALVDYAERDVADVCSQTNMATAREIHDSTAKKLASMYGSAPGHPASVLRELSAGLTVSYRKLADDLYFVGQIVDRNVIPSQREAMRRELDCLSTWALRRTDAGRTNYLH
jgi:hypothetical protein